jgi:hypothetical protein
MGNHITDMASEPLCRRGVTASVVSIVSIVPAFADIFGGWWTMPQPKPFPCALVA